MNPAESVETIRLAWQPEVADYIEAFSARNRQRRVGWILGFMSLVGAAFAVAAIFAGQPSAVGFGVVVAVGSPLSMPLIVRASTKGLWARTEAWRRPVHLVVDSWGISGDAPVITMNPGAMRVATGSVLHRWTDLQMVLETGRVFVVHLPHPRNKVFFLVAKRGLTDPAQEARLRQLLVR